MDTTPYTNPYAADQAISRGDFIQKTYLHVAGALLGLAVIDTAILSSPLGEQLARTFLGGRWSWLIVLGAFMLVSSLANRWAHTSSSRSTQYLGLGLYTVAQAVIMVPLLFMAMRVAHGDTYLIKKAAMATGGLFLGLTAVAFTSKKDFSFLGSIVKIGGFVALGIIIAGIVFGFNLGLFFVGAMILLMAVCILYTTSNVIHHYPTDQYVAASLALFSSIATLFWYVLQFFMSSSD